MKPTESMLVLGIAALATAIAVGALSVPAPLLHSSISQAFMLVIALILFSYSPVVGIAALALFAIIMFHRNVKKTSQYTSVINNMSQYITPTNTGDVSGHDVMQQEHRDIQKFEDTYEAYQSEIAPFEHKQAAEIEPQVDGTFPEQPTGSKEDERMETYMYRPGPDMGDNAFEPVGSSIDEKFATFQY